ncbi:DUF937 domain-containing protein [Methylosinus sp. Ce-a6]|uniref:DUF937 domain-containing protein n=1 Tax=Methylosinus sp. Ce-a6 TaxID=2172005 RepID=UPI001359FE49|nr:DUF937 domain-containing protein [Methylosinus sp. Ce-a6]
MSNIVDIIQSAQSGQIIENLSNRFGLASWQTRSAVEALLPALVAALRKAAEEPQSLRSVIDAANEPAHRAAFESADEAHAQASVEGGDAIVAHLFGSASAAGEVSQLVARESGLRADVLQRLLPVLVSVAAGGLGAALDSRTERPTEQPAPAAPARSGGWLSGLIATFFGKPPSPQPQPQPAEQAAETPQDALETIRATLAAPTSADAVRQTDLDALLGRIFASAKS